MILMFLISLLTPDFGDNVPFQIRAGAQGLLVPILTVFLGRQFVTPHYLLNSADRQALAERSILRSRTAWLNNLTTIACRLSAWPLAGN